MTYKTLRYKMIMTAPVSLSAIKMLGDMLTEKEKELTESMFSTEADLEALNELWLHYQNLLAKS